MPVQPLRTLTSGSVVFVDANVFVYGLRKQSQQSAWLLELCSLEQVMGVTLFEVVNEATHRFMLAEAFDRGLVKSPTASALRKKADEVPRLTAYWVHTQRILSMPLLFVPVSESLIHEAQAVRSSFGLLTNDSLIVACMRHYGISQIASNDEDFGAISGITLLRPDDLL